MSRRLHWLSDCFAPMDTKGIMKALVDNDRFNIGWDMRFNWMTMYESLAFISLDGPEHARTVTVVWNEVKARPDADQGHALISVDFSHWPISELPRQYFLLDSSH